MVSTAPAVKRCGVKNDTIAGFGDPADLYTVKMRQ